MLRKNLLCLVIIAALAFSACGPKKLMPERPTEFNAVIHNISGDSAIPTDMSPGVWAVHAKPYPFYKKGKADKGLGLENLAEDGLPEVLLSNLLKRADVAAAGIFDVPSDQTKPGPLKPGEFYTFTFRAMPGDHFSLATMFIQSNDLFFATLDEGIPLFEKGVPFIGDLTPGIRLMDCGTEVNEVPGIGNYQAPRQQRPDMGAPEHRMIHEASGAFPKAREMIRVSITPLLPPPEDILLEEELP